MAAATDLARTHDLVAAARTDQPSYVALDQDVQTFGQFANLLPVLFLVAGVLGAFIVLSRLVHAQRAVIGTLTANGIAPATLRRHYLSFGLLAGIAAVPFGLAGGYALGAWFTTQYTNALGLPLHVVSLHPATLVVASVAGIAAAGLAAWGPARAAARVAPAEAMRVAPAGHGTRSILERIIPPLHRLPARWRMVLRGLSRNRRRALFTIAGVAVSLSLVIVFAGLRDTVSSVLDRQYGDIDRSDGQLYANPGQAGTLLAAARSDSDVAVAEPFARAEVSLTAGDHRHDTIVWGLPADTTLHRFVATNGDQLSLRDSGGLLLGAGVRNLLDIQVGDPVTVTLADGTRFQEPVAGFVDEPMAAVGYLSLARLQQVTGRDDVTGALVQLRPAADRDAAAHRLGALPGRRRLPRQRRRRSHDARRLRHHGRPRRRDADTDLRAEGHQDRRRGPVRSVVSCSAASQRPLATAPSAPLAHPMAHDRPASEGARSRARHRPRSQSCVGSARLDERVRVTGRAGGPCVSARVCASRGSRIAERDEIEDFDVGGRASVRATASGSMPPTGTASVRARSLSSRTFWAAWPASRLTKSPPIEPYLARCPVSDGADDHHRRGLTDERLSPRIPHELSTQVDGGAALDAMP